MDLPVRPGRPAEGNQRTSSSARFWLRRASPRSLEFTRTTFLPGSATSAR